METPRPEGLERHDTEQDLKAAVAARRELGPEMEDQVLEAFLARVQQRVDAQIAQAVAQSGSKPVRQPVRPDRVQVEIIAGSFALAIPLMAIAGGIAGGVGVVMVVLGLVAVNLLYFIDRWVRFGLDKP